MRYRALLLVALLLGTAAPLRAQVQTPRGEGEDGTAIRLSSPAENLLPHLTLRTPVQMRLFVERPLHSWLAEQLAALQVRLDRNERDLWRRTLDGARGAPAVDERELAAEVTPLAVGPVRPDTVAYLPIRVPKDTTKDAGILPGILSEHADIGFAIKGTGQLGGSWQKFKPCDATMGVECRAGLFPQLRPDMVFGVRVAGKVAERINVNVNFDQANEFDAANNLSVNYQGLPNEILQLVEVGDVSIRLPVSRYMTRGIPAGNFGFRATGQLGPLDFQTVFAQQKGDLTRREFRVTGGGAQQSVVQEASVTIDDADYVKGQFFFLVDPATLTGTPYVDPIRLLAQDAPETVRPRAGGVIQLYRDERVPPSSGAGSELGRFLADALPPALTGNRHSGTFRRLTPDVDYVVHSSGLWITLKSPLRPDEALAMAYITESGDTIGDVNAEKAPAGQIPVLRLVRGPAPVHQPGGSTWTYEMHNVYRLDTSTGVELNSIDMTISLGDLAGGRTFQIVNGEQLPYLRLFGLDEDSPSERLDEAQIYQPSRGAFGQTGTTISGTFIIFPAVEPFFRPGPVPSRNLTADQIAAALGTNANSAIYNEVDPVDRGDAARFKLTFKYRVKADGIASSFSLGAVGIREESERITLGSKRLVKGVDYEIDYDIGQLTLRDPQTLFATNPGAELHAAWEQKPMFQVAPTSVFGLNARYNIGQRGEVNLVGLYQTERSLMARPQLGVEPGSIFLGGVSGGLDLGGALLDRMFGALPGLRLGNESTVRLTGEIAMSSPNPNKEGDAYVEDFESTEEFRIEPRRRDWHLGSRPETNTGDQGLLPFSPDATNAAPLAWTHDYLLNGAPSGAFIPRDAVDVGIRTVGAQQAEYALHLNFGSTTMPPVTGPRWRSLTTVLSSTGRDMSRSEYLEFYASAGAEPIALIIDIGTVSEDAFYVDAAGQTNGQFQDGTEWGLGVLDEEARLAQREVWGTGPGSPDERGLWNQPCLTTPGAVYPFGDPTANCTRGNGLRNSEDLDGNGVLSGTDGEYFRYVVPLERMNEYLVRNRAQTQSPYQLYRIPLRSGVAVNGASDATWRFVKHMRVTVAGQTSGVRLVSLTRMRVVGSRFTKRHVTGVSRGLLDDEPSLAPGTIVNAGPVSALTDATYVIPGAVNQSAQDPSSGIGANGAEINEKSLRIAYEQLAPGERAEVYYRYAQQARSFMNYRQLHLWAMPREGTWGIPEGNRFVVKIGTDARNYYLYQTTLRQAPGGNPLRSDWLPEVVIDFEKWFALKAEAERRQVERPMSAGTQDTVWSADSAYAIVLEDRARAPNLQAVREISFAVYNGGSAAADGEVWIDDMRLTGAARTTGRAGAIGLEVNAGEFITGAVTFARQDDVFQQLNENTPYIASGDLSINADARLDRLLPASWGVDLPLTLSHSTARQDPTFLQNTDVQVDELGNLRETGASNTRIGLRLSKRTPTANPWVSAIIDGTALRFGYSTSDNRSITSRAEAGSFDAGLSYSHAIARMSFDAVPMFLENALRAILPAKIENSPVFTRFAASELRYSPAVISFNTGVQDQMSRMYSYDRILEVEDDTLIAAFESPRKAMQNDVSIGFEPFRGLTTGLSLSSARDLLDPARATEDEDVRRAIGSARSSLAGMNIGWERSRGLNTTLRYEPQIASWLRFTYDYRNRYDTDRNPSYMSEPTGTGSDTVPSMQRRFESGRQTATRLQVRPGDLLTAAFGAPAAKPAGVNGVARGAFRRFESLDLSWTSRLSSQFERESILPGLGYQLGLGDMSSFHVIGADTAARALQSDEFRTTGRIAFTRQIMMDVTYRSTDLDGRDPRGGQRLQHERGWPFVQVRMQDIPLPKSWQKYLLNAVVSGGVERVVTTSSLGSATTPQERSVNSLNIPVSTTLTLPKGIALFYAGKFKVGDTEDPTGIMRSDDDEHSVRLATAIPAPKWFNGKLTQPLLTQLSFMQRGSYQCRGNILQASNCVAYVASTTRTGRFEIASRMADMGIGLSLDYNARQSHVGTQNGTSQFTLNLFGSFQLDGGRMPAGFGEIR